MGTPATAFSTAAAAHAAGAPYPLEDVGGHESCGAGPVSGCRRMGQGPFPPARPEASSGDEERMVIPEKVERKT